MPLANRVSQRAKKVFGPGGDKVRLSVGAFAHVAALARLFFDIYRLFKNSAEPPLRSESAVRKAARKRGINI
jgi:hypothetical protein